MLDLNDFDIAQYAGNKALDELYKAYRMRNTTIHAKQRFGIINAELFRFPYVYKYIKFAAFPIFR